MIITDTIIHTEIITEITDMTETIEIIGIIGIIETIIADRF